MRRLANPKEMSKTFIELTVAAQHAEHNDRVSCDDEKCPAIHQKHRMIHPKHTATHSKHRAIHSKHKAIDDMQSDSLITQSEIFCAKS